MKTRNHNLIVLKRTSIIEFFYFNQKHIKDVLKKGATDLTAEFTVFYNEFEPKISFEEWISQGTDAGCIDRADDYYSYHLEYILKPAKESFLLLKVGA